MTPNPKKKRASAKRPLPERFKAFPERVALARKEAGIPQAAAGTNRVERGERVEGITAVKVIGLAQQFGVRAGWLLTGEEPMRESCAAQDPAPIVAEEVQE